MSKDWVVVLEESLVASNFIQRHLGGEIQVLIRTVAEVMSVVKVKSHAQAGQSRVSLTTHW